MNTVNNILDLKSNNSLSHEMKIEIKSIGPHRPELNIQKPEASKNKAFIRKFNTKLYENSEWLCGCNIKNAFFCFTCLLVGGGDCDPAWTSTGVTDLKHLSEKTKRHKLSVKHINNTLVFAVLGRVDIRNQLDSAYRTNIINHNERVRKNRYILSKLIDVIKFCGCFELALRGHDESSDSGNPGIFRGLVNLIAEVDAELKTHLSQLQKHAAFSGLSKTIQNELLDSIYFVCRDLITQEINQANFIAIQADETTDNSTMAQLVFIVRYESNGRIYERFMGYLKPEGHTADIIAAVILDQLRILNIDKTPEKLIAQSYDGASVMSGHTGGVQAKVKIVYKNAEFIHCYAHQLNLIMQHAASQNKQVKIFFAHLEGFSTFFSRSAKRTAVLTEVVKKRLPRGSNTRWNFHIRTVSTVHGYKEDLRECFDSIIGSCDSDNSTIRKASGLKNMLEDSDFLYWLNFFNEILPHSDILYNQLQQSQLDVTKLNRCVLNFKVAIQKIRDNVGSQQVIDNTVSDVEEEPSSKRRRHEDKNTVVAKEVCDIIVTSAEDRLTFKNHLSAALLFATENFLKYKQEFPQNDFQIAVQCYNLNAVSLKQELVVIYNREDFSNSSGALAFLQFFAENNLTDTFSESVKLLKIICTIPMTTSESERCFSTLNRIKTFSRNTMGQDRLNALAMCAIEKELINNTSDFNELVINHFSKQKSRRMDFVYKSVN